MKPLVVKPFKESLAFYRTRHRTPGCRITHMLGVPLIAIGWLSLLSSRKTAIPCLLAGVALQIAGHSVFEKNQPTLMETHDLTSIPAALVFVGELYQEVFQGVWLENNGGDPFKKRALSPNMQTDEDRELAV